jgi:hypothetical protein
MKVYIGDNQLNDETYKTIKDQGVLKYVADDSECTVIVMDGILRRLNLDSVLITIDDAVKKLRLGGKLKIIDIDFDLLTHVYKKVGNIADLNKAVFSSSEVRSFLTYELVLEILSKYPKLEVSAVNLKNIEFDIEVTRK